MTSATDTRTPHPTRWRLYLARTGEALEVEAPTLVGALRQAGRPDACLLVERTDLLGSEDSVIDATFDPETPTTITARCKKGTTAERIAFVLSYVAQHVNGEADRLAENARLYRGLEERESVTTSPGEPRQ